MRNSKLGLVVAALAVLPVCATGCASLANTPEQDAALSRWKACETIDTQLNRVLLDGRIFFWYEGGGSRQETLDCLSRAAKGGPVLPEPVAELRPRGGGGM